VLVAPPGTSFCAICGQELESISLELWVRKCAAPTLDKDFIGVLMNASTPLRQAAEMGLDKDDAEGRLEQLFAERAGADRSVLREWVREEVEPLTEKSANTVAAHARAMAQAEGLNISPIYAGLILKGLAPEPVALPESTEDRPAVIAATPRDIGEKEAATTSAPASELLSTLGAESDGVAWGSSSAWPAGRSIDEGHHEPAEIPPGTHEPKIGSGKGTQSNRVVTSDEVERVSGHVPGGKGAPHADAKTHTFQRASLVAGAAIVVLALFGWMAAWRGAPRTGANTNQSPTPPPEQGMVFVPGGTFKMGRNDGDNYEGPARDVTVEPFYIDKFEVTCEEYQQFVDKEKRPSPQGWRNGKYPPGTARLPVTGVSWVEADAYAKWAGKRLPTEKEWEFAARGADARLYPWGNEWKPDYVNAADGGPGRPTEVGLHPGGASPFGALDMVGNVWEWTADSIHPYEGGNIPEDRLPERERNSLKVLRGGCYLSNAQQATATYRRGWPERGADYAQTGFRCAKSVESQAARN
jgi:formylglycine-generating enzyme required for sulfatase activity